VPIELRSKQELPANEDVFYIEQGYIGLYVERPGKDRELLFIFKEGEIFPLPDRVMAYEKNASVAYVPLKRSKLRSVPKLIFEAYSLETPARARQLVEELQNQLALALNRIDTMSYVRVYSKLIARLIFFANRFGVQHEECIAIDVPLTYGDIAASIGTTRETVNRLASKLQSSGLIELKGRHIHIASVAGLERELQESLSSS
jgi:CRP/FNR family transcriptional regulator